MKTLLILSVLLNSIPSIAAASAGISYGCMSETRDRFTMTIKPGNKIAYYREAHDGDYAWKGILSPDSSSDCLKDSACYIGAYSASALKPGAAIPKTLIHLGLMVQKKLLNGAQSGHVMTKRINTGEQQQFSCHMLLK